MELVADNGESKIHDGLHVNYGSFVQKEHRDESPFVIRDLTCKPCEIRFYNQYASAIDNKIVATITPDGIMRFNVDASDENALKFVECIEHAFSRRLTGIEVEKVETK